MGVLPEYFDVVDDNDSVIRKELGLECVNLGLLHRAILVFLLNSKGEVYLQKRAEDALFYPGYWSASCTGHVSSGETYDLAARREVKEELGIDCNLERLGKFKSPRWKIGDKVEWEFITIFETTVSNSRITLSDETQEGKFVPLKEFKRMLVEQPEKLTPDTILAAQQYNRLLRA